MCSISNSTMNPKTHAIVCFKNEYTYDGRKIIDLVPCSWLVESGNETFCLYPPKYQAKNIREWAKLSKDPNLKWEKSEVDVIKFACDFIQGERRLSRCEKQFHVQSSTCESEDYESSQEKKLPKKHTPTSSKSSLNLTENASYNTARGINDNLYASSNASNESEEDTDEEYSHHDSTMILNNNNDMKDLERILKQQEQFIIKATKEIVKKEITTAKNSILYNLRKGLEEIKAKMTVRSLKGNSEIELQKELDLDKPFNTYEAFVAFDNGLKDDDLHVKMQEYITLTGQGTKDIADGIKRILPRIISKEVQLKYSGCGRQTGNKKKENFSETKTYEIIRDTFKQLFPSTNSDKELLSKLSRWFSGAPDRDGGRKERMMGKTGN